MLSSAKYESAVTAPPVERMNHKLLEKIATEKVSKSDQQGLMLYVESLAYVRFAAAVTALTSCTLCKLITALERS